MINAKTDSELLKESDVDKFERLLNEFPIEEKK